MQEELTTDMHAEFIGDYIPIDDLHLMGVFGRIRRGVSKEEACRFYGVSVADYEKNIDRVLSADYDLPSKS